MNNYHREVPFIDCHEFEDVVYERVPQVEQIESLESLCFHQPYSTEGSSFEIINESNPLSSRVLIWTINGYTLTVLEQSYSHELIQNKFKIDFYVNILHGGLNFYREGNKVILSIILINCNVLRYVFDIGNFQSKYPFFKLTKSNELCDIYGSTDLNDFLLAEWIDPFHFTVTRQQSGDVLSIEITKDNQIHANTFSTETHSFIYNAIFGGENKEVHIVTFKNINNFIIILMSNGSIEVYNTTTKKRIFNDKVLNSFYNNSFINSFTRISVFELPNRNEYEMIIITTNEKNQRILYILQMKLDNYICQISFMNAIDKVIKTNATENTNSNEMEIEEKDNEVIHNNIYTLNNYIYNQNDHNLYILWNFRDSERSSDCLTCFDSSKNIHYEISLLSDIYLDKECNTKSPFGLLTKLNEFYINEEEEEEDIFQCIGFGTINGNNSDVIIIHNGFISYLYNSGNITQYQLGFTVSEAQKDLLNIINYIGNIMEQSHLTYLFLDSFYSSAAPVTDSITLSELFDKNVNYILSEKCLSLDEKELQSKLTNTLNLINEMTQFLKEFIQQYDLCNENDVRDENQIIKGEMLVNNFFCQNSVLIVNALRDEILYRFNFIISFGTLVYYIIKRIPSQQIENYDDLYSIIIPSLQTMTIKLYRLCLLCGCDLLYNEDDDVVTIKNITTVLPYVYTQLIHNDFYNRSITNDYSWNVISAILLLTESVLMNNDYEILLNIVNNDKNQIMKSYLYPLAELERKYPLYNELDHTMDSRRKWLDVLGYYYIIKATDAKQFKREEEADSYIRKSVELFNQIIPIDLQEKVDYIMKIIGYYQYCGANQQISDYCFILLDVVSQLNNYDDIFINNINIKIFQSNLELKNFDICLLKLPFLEDNNDDNKYWKTFFRFLCENDGFKWLINKDLHFDDSICNSICQFHPVTLQEVNTHSTSLSLASPNYYKQFYCYYYMKQEYIKAARIIYSYIIRLYQDINIDMKIKEEIMNDIITSFHLCINSLKLVQNDNVTTFEGLNFECIYDASITGNYNTKVTEEILEKGLVYSEMQLSLLHKTGTYYHLKPLEIYQQLLLSSSQNNNNNLKDYELCNKFCKVYHNSMISLVENITKEYLNDNNNNNVVLPGWQFQNVEGHGIKKNKYYEYLLQYYLKTCNESESISLHETTLTTIFNDNNFIPKWLIDSFLYSNNGNALTPLILSFLNHNMLFESLEILNDWIIDRLAKQNGEIYIPFDVIDHCIVVGETCIKQNTFKGQSLEKLKYDVDELKKTIKNYFTHQNVQQIF